MQLRHIRPGSAEWYDAVVAEEASAGLVHRATGGGAGGAMALGLVEVGVEEADDEAGVTSRSGPARFSNNVREPLHILRL